MSFKILILFVAFFSTPLDAYVIEINYRSVHSFRDVPAKFKADSHIKDIKIATRDWRSAEGQIKKARLLEIIGPNKVVLEMESPKFRGIYNKYTFDTSKLAPEEQQYIKDLYNKLKNDYFIFYADSEGTKWKSSLSKLEAQKRSIDNHISIIEEQKKAYLSEKTINVSVVVDIANLYSSGASAGPVRAEVWESVDRNKSTKQYDDLIRRLNHTKRDLPLQIKHAKEAITLYAEVSKMAAQSKREYAADNASNAAKTATSSNIASNNKTASDVAPKHNVRSNSSSLKNELEELKKLYDEGLISKENYELKQREILEKH